MHISALYIHPLKSGRAIAVDELALDSHGVVDDRRFMLVDETGKFVTARKDPKLSQVGCRRRSGGWSFEAAGTETLELDDALVDAMKQTPETLTVEIWGDRVQASDCGSTAAAWFTRHLGRPMRLVHAPRDLDRPIDPDFLPDRNQPEHVTRSRAADAGSSDLGQRNAAFSDGFPLLVITRSSLEALGELAAMQLDARRFRPNLVVSGTEAWAEDDWLNRAISVGKGPNSVVLDVVKPCTRCRMTGIDVSTGEVGDEPLRTLVRHRPGTSFGMNLVARSCVGRIRLGDPVEVIGPEAS